jgi:hypothetical protein
MPLRGDKNIRKENPALLFLRQAGSEVALKRDAARTRLF